jgi:general L-amino acid transport system permease protein
LWALSPVVIFILVRGGETFHLQYVPSTQWGGLMLTVFLSLVSMIFAFPLSVLLALGRQSDMPVIRSVSVAYIELVRGVPLISILFMASVVLPLFFPPEMEFSKIMRAMVGITLFFAAYLAENIRGGLQGLARGQYEAADALGLGYWKKVGFIILPQALRIVLPPMVNNFIGILKDTSLVGIIGLIDLLQVAFAATSNPKWLGKIEEAYLFVALFYWIMCYSLSKFSRVLEERYQL